MEEREKEPWVSTAKKHLVQYQKKVNLSSKSFSVKELADSLKEISSTTHQTINSVYQLRKFVEKAQIYEYNDVDEARKMERLVMYSRWFLENLQYLKDLKSQFDEMIYLPLRQTLGVTSNTQTENATDYVLSFKDDIPEIKDLFHDSDLNNVISRLKYLHDRLGYLLEDEGEVDPVFFSLTSAQSFERNCQANESFLRLIPDILRKMSNAGLLVERWLHTASSNIKSESNNNDPTRVMKLERVKTILVDKLNNVNSEIERIERELESESGELQELLEREDRSNLIADRAKSLEQKLSKLEERIAQTFNQITDIKDLVQTAGGNDKFTTKLVADLKKKQKLHDEMTLKLRIFKFEKNLLTEDLSVELEIKPSLIRLTNGLQEKCEQLEAELEAMQMEKQRLEKALKPIVDDPAVVEV